MSAARLGKKITVSDLTQQMFFGESRKLGALLEARSRTGMTDRQALTFHMLVQVQFFYDFSYMQANLDLNALIL